MKENIQGKEKKLNFKPGSISEQVYKLSFEQNKTDDEVAKVIGKEIKDVKYYKRQIELRLEKLNKPKVVETQTTITQNQEMNKFIPLTNGYIKRRLHGINDVDILKTAYTNKDFVLIVGETGTGKTHLIRHFAYENKLPYARINLNGGTTADELIGHWVPNKDGGFKWQDGILTTFVKNGGVIALDEVNACPAEILFCLHSLTDDERTLTLVDENNTVIKAHPNFFLVATMNPDYEGTKPLNQAFKDRFKIKLIFDYDDKIEKKIVEDEVIVELAKKLRTMHSKGEISTPISTRTLIHYSENKNAYGEKLAFEIFLNNFETDEKDAIKNVMELMKSNENTDGE